MESLVFQSHPEITFATNRFIQVPVILQYEAIPLISVVTEVKAGYTTEIPIFHSDGTYLAKVVGSRLFKTAAGEKAGIILRQLPGQTVCELGGRTVFELQRNGPAALKGTAELFTPDGAFIRCADQTLTGFASTDQPLQIGGCVLQSNTFIGCDIGVLIQKNGSVSIGVSSTLPRVSVSIGKDVLQSLREMGVRVHD